MTIRNGRGGAVLNTALAFSPKKSVTCLNPPWPRNHRRGMDGGAGKMIRICSQCHSEIYAREQLAMGDSIMQKADRLMTKNLGKIQELAQTMRTTHK